MIFAWVPRREGRVSPSGTRATHSCSHTRMSIRHQAQSSRSTSWSMTVVSTFEITPHHEVQL